MPHKDKAAAKEYHRQYQARNGEQQRAKRKAYYEANKAKLLARQKTYRDTHKAEKRARARTYYLKNKPSILAKSRDYDAITKARIKERYAGYRARNAFVRAVQMGRPKPDVCDVCYGNTGGIVFDHCHKKNIPRGWLCWRCNVVLGHVDDSPATLRKLIAYLERTHANTSPQLTLAGI